jgi:uncharacterized membrane protein
MRTASSHQWTGLSMLGAEKPSSSMHAADAREAAAHHEADEIRRGVTWQEKLLLLGILLIVAGWILFRLVLQLLTTG